MRWLDAIINLMHMSLSKLGDSEGQGGLVCCSSWGCRELDYKPSAKELMLLNCDVGKDS